MALLASLFASFALAAVATPLYGRTPRAFIALAGVVPLLVFAYFASLMPRILSGETERIQFPWFPELGIQFSLQVDGLSLLFALLISGIGFLISVYSAGYLKKNPSLGRFYSYLFLFMGSMLGVVLSRDLILLFVFWEMTSIASFLLIGFNHEKEGSRYSSLQALLVTSAGALALLAGFLMLGQIGGTFDVTELISNRDLIQAHPRYSLALVLILLGAFSKSAQFPFHFWLPNAMVAPTPVSAYLHSATMVKAGVYLLARLYPSLGGTSLWQISLTFAGSITAVIGAVLALKQTDLKKLLAFSTVGSLGMLVMLLGLSSDEAVGAAVVYLLVHSLYKGALFMVAGAVDHSTGTRDVLGLRGLAKAMPLTAAAAGLAALSMAGFPPLFGFIGKELLYQAKFESPNAGWALYALGVGSNAAMVAVAFIVGIAPFLGSRLSNTPRIAEEVPFALRFGPVVLALLGLAIGLLPMRLGEPLLSAAATSIAGTPQEISLKYWHGFNVVFFFSAITLGGGFLLFLFRERLRETINRSVRVLKPYEPERVYLWCMEMLPRLAVWQTRILQHGSLTRYILLVILSAAALISATIITGENTFRAPRWSFGPDDLLIALLVILGGTFTALSRSRILAVASIGVIGYTIALFYAEYSAPDVALTQILVETLSVVLTVFLISRLPPLSRELRARGAVLKSASAIGIGVLMAWVTRLAMMDQKGRVPISEFFGEKSLIEAQGRNVVNVILVDFRALDTLGEITVLAVAMIGVFALLSRSTLTGTGDQ